MPGNAYICDYESVTCMDHVRILIFTCPVLIIKVSDLDRSAYVLKGYFEALSKVCGLCRCPYFQVTHYS